MARNKGNFNLAANFQVKIQEALDPRLVVENKVDLINKNTWPLDGDTLYVYEGMIVGVSSENSAYILTDISKILNSDYSGWLKIGATDSEISDTSTNAVQNKVVKEYIDLHPQYESVDEIDVPELDLPMVECDSELSTTSIKPVQNRVVTQALNNKVDKVSGKQLSTEDFTTSLKNKLVGLKEFDPTEIYNEIDVLAQQVTTKQNTLVSGTSIKTVEGQSLLGSGNISIPVPTVDSTLSDTSANAVQNKAVKAYVDSNIYEQRIIYRAENGTLTTSQRTYNAETYTKLINREKIAVYYSDFNNTPLLPLSVGLMNMITNVITLVHYSGVAPNIATTTFELHSDGNVESTSMLYVAPSIDAALSSTSTQSVQNKVITAALDNKVDKVTGKGLSTEDFTTALKTKLEGLNNYDDAAIQNAVNGLTTQLNTLVSGDASTAIESFNEITAFLANVTDEESLEGIVAGIEQQISAKQDTLVSGNTIKTINGQSILGEGDIVFAESGKEVYVGSTMPTDEDVVVWIDPNASIGDVDWDGVVVDEELSPTSTNPIQNKTVYALSARLDGIEAILDNIIGE